MIAATVSWPPIQMHAATTCTQRTNVGPETLSTPCYSRTRAPVRQKLVCPATHDAVEVDCLHRVDGHFEAAFGTQPTEPPPSSPSIAAHIDFADGLSHAHDAVSWVVGETRRGVISSSRTALHFFGGSCPGQAHVTLAIV